jgi:hypothetical protein
VPPAPPFKPSTHPTSLGRSSCFTLRCHFPDKRLGWIAGSERALLGACSSNMRVNRARFRIPTRLRTY